MMNGHTEGAGSTARCGGCCDNRRDRRTMARTYFSDQRHRPKDAALGDGVDDDALVDAAASRLVEYLAGDRTDFDLPVHTFTATRSTRRCGMRCAAFRFGTTTTYGQVAAEIGMPQQPAARRGQAVGRNPVGIVVVSWGDRGRRLTDRLRRWAAAQAVACRTRGAERRSEHRGCSGLRTAISRSPVPRRLPCDGHERAFRACCVDARCNGTESLPGRPW